MFRIWKNLKWLFNHPPTSIINNEDMPPCDYCGATDKLWRYEGIYCICANCRKKVYDRILKKKGK
jgi:hypothetical protein